LPVRKESSLIKFPGYLSSEISPTAARAFYRILSAKLQRFFGANSEFNKMYVSGFLSLRLIQSFAEDQRFAVGASTGNNS
jgi:hypothetical protein